MQITITGQLAEVSPYIDKGERIAYDIILFVPKFQDQFGRELGKDNYFKIQVFERKDQQSIRTNIAQIVGQLVKTEVFINGNKYTHDNKPIYFTNLVLKNIQPVEA